ncbi:shikimate dehydrogenase [Nesterenkonia sp. F]|uniref:shikimate dehydrogenase family protein n=1 Tax=Nesterenkonia sp. F TaxID=795955 RepID=UPI000255D58F|nr:shikimate 5-dehydrogenase [Nesterenkonia sp. F]
MTDGTERLGANGRAGQDDAPDGASEGTPIARAAVLGSPIGHSLSPALHGAAYAHLGLAAQYTRRDVDVEGLDAFLRAADADPSGPPWLGWSVTMPLKAAMVEHMDAVSERVRRLGVLNTVVHRDGRRRGENTDVDGIVAALREAGPEGLRPAGGGASGAFVIVGAGATAAATLAAAAELGFAEVRCHARAPERAEALRPVGETLGLRLSTLPLEDLVDDLAGRGEHPAPAAVVSTLPPGAADGLAEQIAASSAAPGAAGAPSTAGVPLLDVAYDPWPSRLATAWESLGGAVVSGLSMLLHQAVAQIDLFTAATRRPAADEPPASRAAMIAAMRTSVGLPV